MEKLNMYQNFELLVDRVINSLEKTDLLEVKEILSSIKDNTLVSGVGGSSVVSLFASKVLEEKNDIITKCVQPRDFNYMKLSKFINVLSCSYGGLNYGVETSFNNDLVHYLLSCKRREGVNNITYNIDNDIEESYISLSATLIPMAILLSYYLDNNIDIIYDILSSKLESNIECSNIYEILTGYETSCSSRYLDSTLTEAGLSIPAIHDKYDYCHGRSTIARDNKTVRILLNSNTDLDKKFIDRLENLYVLERKYDDDIVNDFYLTYMCMLLTKEIAHMKEQDLSLVKYLRIGNFYKFNGGM
jgi:hypothetical protein